MNKDVNLVWITANLLSRERKKICIREAGVEYRQQGAHDKISCLENQA